METKKVVMAVSATDPVLRALIRHAESEKTAGGIMAMESTMQRLGAEQASILITADGTTGIILVCGDCICTAWHYADSRAEVSGYDIGDDGEWVLTDRYRLHEGVILTSEVEKGGNDGRF